MLLFAFVIIAVLIAGYFTFRRNGDFTQGFGSLFVSLMVLGCIYPFVLVSTGHSVRSEPQVLSAFKDSTEVAGSFFLGSGTIDGDPVYKYVVKNEQTGEVQIKTIDESSVRLFETDEAPRVVTTYTQANSPWIILGSFTYNTEYEIYIPKGSVISEFEVDLEG